MAGLSSCPPRAVCPSQSVCPSTHPSTTLNPNPSKCSPEPVPSDPLPGTVMKGLFITLQLGQLFQMFPIPQPDQTSVPG